MLEVLLVLPGIAALENNWDVKNEIENLIQLWIAVYNSGTDGLPRILYTIFCGLQQEYPEKMTDKLI